MFKGDQIVHSFHNGNLHLACLSIHPNWVSSPLFHIAERINPKRTFLFVSTVLGKHIPVKPSTMDSAYQDLVDQLPILNGNVTVIGMAETAVGLGAGVFSKIEDIYPESIYLCSTRFRIPEQPVLCEFVEEHSHAQDQIIHASTDESINKAILETETLVLIDDEITTGKTLNNVVASLVDCGFSKIKEIVVISLVSWAGENDISFALPNIKVTSINLFHGNYSWEPVSNPNPPVRNMPFSNLVGFSNQPILSACNWGRIPTRSVNKFNDFDHILNDIDNCKKYLVLGTNEYLWPPYMLSKAIEELGCEVHFSSTTRSPVLEGDAIKHTKSFADNYGQGIQNFAYNVNPDLYDEILIVVETSEQSVDQQLLDQIGHKSRVINLTNNQAMIA